MRRRRTLLSWTFFMGIEDGREKLQEKQKLKEELTKVRKGVAKKKAEVKIGYDAVSGTVTAKEIRAQEDHNPYLLDTRLSLKYEKNGDMDLLEC